LGGKHGNKDLPEACSAERTLAIVRMRALLNYSEHFRLEANVREHSGVLTLLNRPQKLDEVFQMEGKEENMTVPVQWTKGL
jgi:hypothetical protein